MTSPPRDRADAARLLAPVRGHWRPENGLRHVRDVTPGGTPAGPRTAVVCPPSGVAATGRHPAARPFEAAAWATDKETVTLFFQRGRPDFARDPLNQGESRESPTQRPWFYRPLCLGLLVDDAEKTVYVVAVKWVGR